ncbi:uncharacterized protein GIQ15_06011 [Arthroderma uncinatum]|uniref:uncharacterized protein n=1 Tax=Arthroderma uncinatum TaxID=74035 RepID=UPI00144AAC5A|nr:uncharacterized protein GIQ15_06011 [Arthroderma uncinatum]KAF3480664.1 hypothetical protein GIQ15_06011 [Arthroderma uncinatum]
MSAAYEVYSLDNAIDTLFKSTSATREACEEKAARLVGGKIIPVPIQGCCSYTVYAGAQSEFVVQFRLELLQLQLEIAALAHEIHGNLAPLTTYHGHLGDINDRPVFVYTLSRIPGVNYLEYHLANQHAENSEESMAMRGALIEDLAR